MIRSRLSSFGLLLLALPLMSGPTPYSGIVLDFTITETGVDVTSWVGSRYIKDTSGTTLNNAHFDLGEPVHASLGVWFDAEFTILSTDVANDECEFAYRVQSVLFGNENAGVYTAPLGDFRISMSPYVRDPFGPVLPPGDNTPAKLLANDSFLLLAVKVGQIDYWVQSNNPSCPGDIIPLPPYYPTGSITFMNPSGSISSSCYGDFSMDVLTWSPMPYVLVQGTGVFPFDTNTYAPYGTWLCTFND